MTNITKAAQQALEALEEIALAGMSGSGQESEEGMRDWHARQAWKFIGIAARALDPLKSALTQRPTAQPTPDAIREHLECIARRACTDEQFKAFEWVIDTTFESLDLLPAPQQATQALQSVCRYISDVLAGDASSGEKHIARTIMHLLPLEQAVAAQQATPEPVGEPLFWCRPRSDGGYEGPLHDSSIEDVRKRPGAWMPLYTQPAPVVPDGFALVPVSLLIEAEESVDDYLSGIGSGSYDRRVRENLQAAIAASRQNGGSAG